MPREEVLSDDEDIQNFWVFVKHPDSQEEYAQVHQIDNFHPKHKEDFKYGLKYVLKTSRWSENNKVQLLKVYIIRIERTLEELKEVLEKRRVKYPLLKPSESDYVNSESEVERQKKVSERQSPAELEKLKKAGAEKDAIELTSLLTGKAPGKSGKASINKKLSEPSTSSSHLSSASPARNKQPIKRTSGSLTSCTITSPPTSKKPKESSKPIAKLVKNNSSGSSSYNVKSVSKTHGKEKVTPVSNSEFLNQHLLISKESSSPFQSSSNQDASNNSSTGSSSVTLVLEGPDGKLEQLNFNDTLQEKNETISKLEKALQSWKERALQKEKENLDDPVLKKLGEINDVLGDLKHRVEAIESAITQSKGSSEHKVSAIALTLGVKSSNASSSSSIAQVSSSLDVQDEKVHLGSGIWCNIVAFNTLNTTTRLDHWRKSLLQGVFGEEAKYQRYQTKTGSKDSITTFSFKFQQVTKVLYESFLKRTGSLQPSESDVKKIFSQLSKTARDLCGRRNTGQGKPKVIKNYKKTENNTEGKKTDGEKMIVGEEAAVEDEGNGNVLANSEEEDNQQSDSEAEQEIVHDDNWEAVDDYFDKINDII